MKQSIQFWLASGIALCIFTTTIPTRAQIVPDTTLPNNSSVTTEGSTSVITAGTRVGSNLFHSFEQFSVPTGSTAYFNNNPDIQNIINRVTGSIQSNIDGLIQANGSTNLFLLNPNGIIFGPNASLNIGGSFLASTASSLNFADGIQFSATAPQTTTLLTVSVPVGLQFGPTAGEIRVQGPGAVRDDYGLLLNRDAGLQVQPEATLALVGSGVTLEGGILTTEGGRIELGSVAEPGIVSLTPTENGFALGYKDVSTFGDLLFRETAAVDLSGQGGGDLQVWGRQVRIQDGSSIEAYTLGAEPGGTLNVNATESIALLGNSALLSLVAPGASGTGGNLTIETGQLIVQDQAFIATDTYGIGRGGNLLVKASDSVELSQSVLSSLVGIETIGTGGNLTIETGQLTVQDEALIATDTYGIGRGGNLAITTKQLIVQSGAQVKADTFSAGKAGDLVVRASDSVELFRQENSPTTGLFTRVIPDTSTGVILEATGDGGNLTIETRRLSVQNGAQVTASTFGPGNGGILTINSLDSVELSGTQSTATPFRGSSGLFVSAEPGATGNVGSLSITTEQLLVQNGAKISADNFGTGEGGSLTLSARQLIVSNGGLVRSGSFGEGPGGSLTVNASESVEVSGTGAIGPDQVNSTLFTQSEASGDAGDLAINTETVTVKDGADVTVSSTGLGNAGELRVAAGEIFLDRGKLLASTASGEGGNIYLQVEDLILMRQNSLISAEASGTANGGNITIDTPLLVAAPAENSENNDIIANAFEGAGGFIQISAQGVLGLEPREELTPQSDITAFSQQNPELDGVVEINTPAIDPSQGIVALPTNFVDVSGLIASGCDATDSIAQGEFIVTGRGGLPPSPSDTISSDSVWSDLRDRTQLTQKRTNNEAATQPINVTTNKLVEAQGWVFNNRGEVVLTASASTVTPHSAWQTPDACAVP